MLNLVFDDAKLFKRIIDAISVLVDQGEFVIDDNGLTLRAADQAMIAMVDFTFPKTAFKEYVVSGTTKLGIDLDALSRVLSRARSEDSLVLGLTDDGALFKVSLKGNAERTFTLPLLDLSGGELPTPKIEFDADLTIVADILQDGVKDAKLFNTYVTLKAEGDKFEMIAKGTSGNLDFTLSTNDDAMISATIKNASSASFPLDYLEDILKQTSKDTKVNLSLKGGAPIKLSYKINEASLVYFIAPRAEAD